MPYTCRTPGLGNWHLTPMTLFRFIHLSVMILYRYFSCYTSLMQWMVTYWALLQNLQINKMSRIKIFSSFTNKKLITIILWIKQTLTPDIYLWNIWMCLNCLNSSLDFCSISFHLQDSPHKCAWPINLIIISTSSIARSVSEVW